MAQLTPYPGQFYQIHGMTSQITLFEQGLAKTTADTAQPRLAEHFNDKVDKSKRDKHLAWDPRELKQRTQAAIDFVGRDMAGFKANAKPVPLPAPFCGQQQIPGKDASLRA